MSCASTTSSTTFSQRFKAVDILRAPKFARLNFARWRAAAAILARCIERRRQRLALLELDDCRLADLGITREQALEEARKPFWR